MEAVVVLAFLVALAILALRFGEDSRDGFHVTRPATAGRRIPVWWAEAGGDRRGSDVATTW